MPVLSYAGVPLILPTPELYEFVSTTVKLSDVYEFAIKDGWPGKNIEGLTARLSDFKNRPVRPGVLWWPNGLSRWAVGHFLCDSNQLADIRAALTAAVEDGLLQPADLVLDTSDSKRPNPTTPQAPIDGESITCSMYMLPPRQLTGIPWGANTTPATNGLHLLTLVDVRYYLWLNHTESLEVTEDYTWTRMYEWVQDQTGLTINVGTIDVDFLRPHPGYNWLTGDQLVPRDPQFTDFESRYEAIPPFLDAIAYNAGQVVTVTRGGTVFCSNIETAKTSLQSELDAETTLNRAAVLLSAQGYDVESPNYRDAPPVLPEAVRVTFPVWTNGEQTDEVWEETVPLSAVLPSVGIMVEGEKTFHDTCIADVPIDDVRPNTETALNALALKIATFYYKSRIYGRVERVYDGIINWLPDGLTDGVEWSWRLLKCHKCNGTGKLDAEHVCSHCSMSGTVQQIRTRIYPAKWNDDPEELLHHNVGWTQSALRFPIVAIIDGTGTGANDNAHSWTEQEVLLDGDFQTRPAGLGGIATASPIFNPAYEINGDIAEVGDRVILFKGLRPIAHLTADVTSSSATLLVDDARKFGAADVIISVGTEAMLVSARDATSFTVTRGYAGTTATAHSKGARVKQLTQTFIFALGGGGSANPSFLAKISSGTNPYAWNEVDCDVDGTFHVIDPPTGKVGTECSNPAWELNRNDAIAAGTIVRMWPCFTESGGSGCWSGADTEYVFHHAGSGGSGAFPCADWDTTFYNSTKQVVESVGKDANGLTITRKLWEFCYGLLKTASGNQDETVPYTTASFVTAVSCSGGVLSVTTKSVKYIGEAPV